MVLRLALVWVDRLEAAEIRRTRTLGFRLVARNCLVNRDRKVHPADADHVATSLGEFEVSCPLYEQRPT